MDSSPVLYQQSPNKIRSDFQRMKNEYNRKHAKPKLSKLLPSPRFSGKDCENKDPGESCRRPPLQPGVSRLPVLAKYLRLETPSDFSHSHLRWEGKALSGKAKKKKPCTRPIPFNLSQPKRTKLPAENDQTISASHSKAIAAQSKNKPCNAKPKQVVLTSKGDSTKFMGKSYGKTLEKVSHLSGQPRPSNTSKTLSIPLSVVSSDTRHQNKAASSVQPAVCADICLANMNLLSLKDASKTPNCGQTPQLATQENPPQALNGENFQPDHAALLSILRNEGVSILGRVSATPQSKGYNYLPQRVSIMKNQQKGGSTTVSAQFSPDPAALQSILLNEGVKDGGPVGATPRYSACPSGRGTSVYMAQRVPVTKKCAETTAGSVAASKWTPMRVRNTSARPMSAMKWHQQQSVNSSLRDSSYRSNLQPHEDVVQKLFDDGKDEQALKVMDEAPRNIPQCDVNLETSKASCEEEDEEELQQQALLHAPHRESVIFYSTGKKLLRFPRFENLRGSAHQSLHGPVSSDQGTVPAACNEISARFELISQINPSVQHVNRVIDLVASKSYPNPAVAMLRKRLPLEEMRLDEEVASYTSVPVPAAPGFASPRPRCENPLASILHFEESSRFLPIVHLSSGASSLHDSLLHGR